MDRQTGQAVLSASPPSDGQMGAMLTNRAEAPPGFVLKLQNGIFNQRLVLKEERHIPER